MELKRRYRKGKSGFESRNNRWIRRNLSLIGTYHFTSAYGESVKRPALIAMLMVFGFTFIWITQSDPTLEPQFAFYGPNSNESQSYFIGTA
jgi:hypothetical protein